MSNDIDQRTDEKKCSRKQKRAHHRVMRDMNIQCCDEPTEYLMICNAGLATGLQTEELEDILNPAVQRYDLIMPPGKSYCFIKFSSKEDASIAYNFIHGHARLSSNNGPLYVTYTRSVPDVDDTSTNSTLPSGLRLIENLITQEQEENLIKNIDWNDEGTFSSELKHRKVRHFGYEFKYKSNKVDVEEPIEPIPETYKFLYTLFKEHGCGNYEYDQLTINCYSPGQGIPPHIDTHSMFEDTILSLSLGSSCVMDFKRNDKKVSVFLPQRSLLIMKDEARYAWTHGICPRHYDPVNKKNSNAVLTTQPRGTRISFTFRKTRTGDCCCDFLEECDTKQNHYDTSNINNNISAKLESFYVHNVYEEISDHFNETRHKPWPNVIKFLQSLNRGDILLDVGCGNGKYLQPDDHIFKIGCDRSFGLTEISRQRGFEVLLSDCLYLPYKDNAVDAVICIAVIHHLTSHERRKQAVLELARVLKPNGKCLIYVWAKEQNKDSVKSNYLKDGRKGNGEEKQEIHPVLKRTECGLILPVHENRTEFVHNDMLVPWKRKGGGQFLRYYHVFQQNELFELCSDISFVTIKDLYYDQGNWCIIIEKQNSNKDIE